MLNYNTVNRKYFVVLDSLAYAKIKHAKMCTIKGNAVQGRLSANYVYLTWKIIAWNILNMKYSQFTTIITFNYLFRTRDTALPLWGAEAERDF